MSNKELHQNYIMILMYLHPDIKIKQHVIDDKRCNGYYHNNLNWLEPLVKKILFEIEPEDDKHFDELDNALRNFEAEDIYLACVKIIKRYNKK